MKNRFLLPLMCACVVLVMCMVAAINLAVPKLAASGLHPTAGGLLWIVDAYVIVFACLLIPAGALGDRWGRKNALLAGLALFALGCLISGLATSTGVLLVGRAVTGAGAALIMPATLAVLMFAAEPARRPHVIATWTLATGLGGLVGNAVGGPIMEYLPWQGLFWALLPVAVLLFGLVSVSAPQVPRHNAALDLVGTALLTGSLLALLYGIIEGPGEGWTSAHVVGGFSVGVVLMGVFVVYAMNTATPLLDPRVFKLPKLRGGTLGIGVAFFGLFSLFFVNAQFLQYAKGYSALLTGFAILPLGVGMAVASRNSVRLVGRFGARRVSGIGLGAVVAGLLLMSFVDKDTAYLLYVVYLTVLSAGLGLVTPPLSTWVMGSLPPERAGLGSGLNGAAREIGSALGVAVFGTVLISSFESHLPEGTPKGGSIGSVMARTAGDPAAHDKLVRAFTDAMSTGFRTVAVVVLVAAALVMLWSRERVRVPV